MNVVSLCLITAAAVELLWRLPFVRMSRQLVAISGKALRVIALKSASDHRKEKVLMAYSGRMAGMSLGLAAIAASLVMCVFLLSRVLDALFASPVTTLNSLATWHGVALSLAVSILYALLRVYIVRAVRGEE